MENINLFKSIFLNKKNLNNCYLVKNLGSNYHIQLICQRILNNESEKNLIDIESNYSSNINKYQDFYLYICNTKSNVPNDIINSDIIEIKKFINNLKIKNNFYPINELIEKIKKLQNYNNLNIIVWFLDSYRNQKYISIYTNMDILKYNELFFLNKNYKYYKILNYSQIPNKIDNFLNILDNLEVSFKSNKKNLQLY